MSALKHLAVSLFTESVPEEPGVRKTSIGRICFFIVFVHAGVVWGLGNDIPSGELETLWALMAYVFGTKLVEGLKVLRK
jgi:hypothetical protein